MNINSRPLLLRVATIALCVPLGAIAPAELAAQTEVVQPLPPAAERRLSDALSRLSRNSRNLSALRDAGSAALELGDLDAALGFYGRAQDLAPNDPSIKMGMAAVFLRSDRPIEALRLFSEAEAAGASSNSVSAERGLAYDLVGNTEQAQQSYRQALARGGGPEVMMRLALSQAIAGNRAGFETTILPLIEQRNPAAYRARAFGLAILGEAEEANALTEAVMPKNVANQFAPYFAYMPRLTKAQQAAAANLGIFPQAAQIGRDDPRIVQFANSGTVAGADARLTPQGEPLGTLAAQAATDNRRRRPDRMGSGSAAPSAPTASEQLAAIRDAAKRDPASRGAGELPAIREAQQARVQPGGELPPIGNPAASAPQVAAAVPAAQNAATSDLSDEALAATSAAASAFGAEPTTALASTPTPATIAAPTPVQTPAAAQTVASSVSGVVAPNAAPSLAAASTASGELPAIVEAAPAAPAAALAPPALANDVAEAVSDGVQDTALAAVEAPAAQAPATQAPATQAPATQAPATQALAAQAVSSVATPALAQAAPDPGFNLAETIDPNAEAASALASNAVPDTIAQAAADAVEASAAQPAELASSPASEAIAPAAIPAPVAQPAPEPRQSVSNAFADFSSGGRTSVEAAQGAVDISAIEVPREVEEKPEEPSKPAHPERFWVQIASVSDVDMLKSEYRRITRKAGDLLETYSGHSAEWGETNRLLAGPVASRKGAETLVEKLKDEGVSSFVHTSEQGKKVNKLQ